RPALVSSGTRAGIRFAARTGQPSGMMPQLPLSCTVGDGAGNKAGERVFIAPSPRRPTHDKCVCQALHATPEGWMTMGTLVFTPDPIRLFKSFAVVAGAALLAASAAATAPPATLPLSLT